MFNFFRRNKNKNKTENTTEQPDSQIQQTPQERSAPETESQTTLPVVESSEAHTDIAEKATETTTTANPAPAVEPAPSQPIATDAVAIETVTQPEEVPVAAPAEPIAPPQEEAPKPEKKKGFFARLKEGLSKTRKSFTDSLASLVLGKKEIDQDLLDELEMILLTADVGIDATDRIIQNLTDQVSRKELSDPQALIESLKQQLEEIIIPVAQPLNVDTHLQTNGGPFVILMVGINGVGKTTTIGKLAKKFQSEGKSVMLAAGDTFRAAAVEQLETWGERNNVPVIAQKTGADSAAVIFDAVQSAKAKNIDVLIADTAGRLHTQSNLMEELKKVKRVITKVDGTAPHEVMLVIDAGTGQNAINQAKQFSEAVEISGITLTKLDGTAKGGILFALSEQMGIPIRFIGVGESIDDLRPFEAKAFTQALFSQKESD